MPRILDLLRKLPLFADLSGAELEPIARGTRQQRFDRGATIFNRGEPCVGFHLVVYGQVKLVFVSSSGSERVIRLIGPGDGFGEALMFMGQNYIVTAVTLCDTLLLHVGRDAIFEQLEVNPRMARRMLAGLSRRLYNLLADLQAHTQQSGSERLIAFLLEQWPGKENMPFRIEISKAVVASRLNLTPEHFSRILRDLIDRNLIRVHGREFTILDVQGLRELRA